MCMTTFGAGLQRRVGKVGEEASEREGGRERKKRDRAASGDVESDTAVSKHIQPLVSIHSSHGCKRGSGMKANVFC